jgi:hypothetical protein
VCVGGVFTFISCVRSRNHFSLFPFLPTLSCYTKINVQKKMKPKVSRKKTNKKD